MKGPGMRKLECFGGPRDGEKIDLTDTDIPPGYDLQIHRYVTLQAVGQFWGGTMLHSTAHREWGLEYVGEDEP